MTGFVRDRAKKGGEWISAVAAVKLHNGRALLPVRRTPLSAPAVGQMAQLLRDLRGF